VREFISWGLIVIGWLLCPAWIFHWSFGLISICLFVAGALCSAPDEDADL
jgi:hypothetical protein